MGGDKKQMRVLRLVPVRRDSLRLTLPGLGSCYPTHPAQNAGWMGHRNFLLS